MENHLPTKLPYSKKPLRARVIISYILDYAILIGLILGFFILDKVEPYHQPFSLENYSLHYPYAVKERIPIPLALAISGGFPILVIVVYTILIDGLFSHHSPRSPSTGKRKLMGPYRWKDRLWELNCGVLGLLLSQAAAFVITAALKNACGKPRPDIIDRCQPREVQLGRYELANHSMCTQTDHEILKDGFRSFPSGHSSSSFAGLFYISLYLAGKLHVLDSRGEVWKSFIVMVPTLAAAIVTTSRVMDARHHPFDVVSGSLLGILCAWGSYRQYFPPITEPWKKGRAYPIRTWGTMSQPPPDADRARLVASVDPKPTDEEEYRGMATSQQPPDSIQRTHSGSDGNPFEPVQPNPFLRRVGTEVPSNYSSSSSELQSNVGNNNSNNDAFEMRSDYRSTRPSRQQTSESMEALNQPIPGYAAHRPPAYGRDESPGSPDLGAHHVRA